MRTISLVIIVAAIMMLVGCSSKVNTEIDPRRVVMNMFGAMEENNREDLAHYLDFSQMLGRADRDYALSGDSARVFYTTEEILADLVDGGLTKKRWFSMQRVVGECTQSGDSALVEVSFIDQSNGTQYYTKFGLRSINGVWKIYSFRAINTEEQ